MFVRSQPSIDLLREALWFEFANTESCAAGAPPRMKLFLPYP
jgi:hypothetical protein